MITRRDSLLAIASATSIWKSFDRESETVQVTADVADFTRGVQAIQNWIDPWPEIDRVPDVVMRIDGKECGRITARSVFTIAAEESQRTLLEGDSSLHPVGLLSA